MFKALSCFIRERFSLEATVPLAMILFGAPAGLVGIGWRQVAVGGVTSFLALLILRIVDDISDIKTDMVVSPERGFVSGKIDVNKLKKSALLCFFLILFLNYTSSAFLTVLSVVVFYFTFYSFKGNIPYVLHPLFVNVIFPTLPLYAGTLKGGVDMSLILLAFFLWTAVIAHDYGHSVHGPSEGVEGVQSFSNSLGAKKSAMLAVLAFVCSSLTGFLFWIQSDLGLLFPLVLSCTSILIAKNSVKLLKHPVKAVARKLYISGFVYFLVPLIAIIVETAFKPMNS